MIREQLGEQLLKFVPLLHKKIKKGMHITGISRQQLVLLVNVLEDNGKTMRYYCEKMMIPKSNLTVLADKLIEHGLLEREPDPGDRRVILLKITPKGNECLKEHEKMFKQALAKKLEVLSDEDVKRLNKLLEEMINIFNKINY